MVNNSCAELTVSSTGITGFMPGSSNLLVQSVLVWW